MIDNIGVILVESCRRMLFPGVEGVESVGIVRRIDRLGRIALPKSLRRRFKIEHGDYLEITIDGNSIILSECRPRCAFCGGTVNADLILHERMCV